jgi:methyl coenzyme M reductase subunit C-like uncharacterized protein (methanogenesis marker protein 7)
VTAPATVKGMPESSEQDPRRQRGAVEREMRRIREAEEDRESRDLVDTVSEEQQRDRERADEE